MGFLFSAPKAPKMPEIKPPVAPPTIDTARESSELEAIYRRRKGRAATILSMGGEGVSGNNAKTVLGL